jgi:hypothetical protein
MSPFYDQYRRCIDQVRGIGERYARFKKVGPRDLWGPSQRQRWYEEQMEVGQQLTEAGMLDPHTLDAAATVCARS